MSSNIPQGNSFPKAFAHLFNESSPTGKGFLNPFHNQQIRTDEEAMRVFYTYCTQRYCDYVRGRPMKIGVDKLPDHSSYNRCDYFTDAVKATLNNNDAEEFRHQFETCKIFQQNKEKTSEVFKKNHPAQRIFKQCTVDYTFKIFNLPGNIPIEGTPCEDALNHLKSCFSKNRYIDDFRVCYSPLSWSFPVTCKSSTGPMEMRDVIDILQKETLKTHNKG